MDAVDILKTCLRRWYVMLPILLGAAGVSYQLVGSQETTYTAATSYGLVQPQLPVNASEADRNPLGADGKALVGAALQAQLNSQETQRELGSAATRGWGPGQSANGSSYSVEIPMYQTTYEVRAWGQDAQAVREVVDRVVAAAPGITDELQSRAGAPAGVRYKPFILAATQVEALPSTSAAKLVVAVMGVGVLVGAAWAIVTDRLLGRRRQAERTVTSSSRPVLRPAGPRPAPSRPASTADPAVPPLRQRPPRAQPPRGGQSSLRR